MSDLLYLDTARLGRMSSGAAAATRDLVSLAADEGGGLYFDRFLAGGLSRCPFPFANRYPGLAGWRGVDGLKADLRAVADGRCELPVLLASRSATLVRFGARLLCHPCRNILTTDLDWPPYAATLTAEAQRAGRRVTVVPVRDLALSGRITQDEMADLLCDRFAQAHCDGLYLTALSNTGVRLPSEQVVRRLEATHRVRAVVIDGAQEFGHVPPGPAVGHCDLYLAGTHKWLCGHLPLGVAFYGRRRSRGRVETLLTHMTAAGELDDPLLRYSSPRASRPGEAAGETIGLVPLFSAQGAVTDALESNASFTTRLQNARAAAAVAAAAGWAPLLPSEGLRSGILLVRAIRRAAEDLHPEELRAALRVAGIAATTYSGGLARLSMPASAWHTDELDHLSRTLRGTA